MPGKCSSRAHCRAGLEVHHTRAPEGSFKLTFNFKFLTWVFLNFNFESQENRNDWDQLASKL